MLNRFMFPTITPSYTAEDIKKYLFYIPRRLDQMPTYLAHNNPGLDSIPCLWIPCYGTKRVLLYSHGNGCDLGQMCPELKIYANRWKVNVVAYEYEGYGIHTGRASTEACNRDIQLVYKFLTSELKVPASSIIIYGRSIGTGPSSFLASTLKDSPPGCLMLQSPFTTIRALAQHLVGFIGMMSPNPFDNLAAIQNLTCPLM